MWKDKIQWISSHLKYTYVFFLLPDFHMSKFLDLVCYIYVNLEESTRVMGDLAVFASLLATNLEKSEVSHLKYRILELK